MMKKQLSKRDWEMLSAYLDGQLSGREQAQFKTRLQQNPQLRATLQELRRTRQVVRSLPRLRAPRNFTLSPQDVPQKRTFPRLVPAFSLVSAAASLLLIIIVFIGMLSPAGGATSVAVQADEVPAMEMAPDEKFLAAEPEMLAEEDLAEEPAMLMIEEDTGTAEASAPEALPVEAPAAEAVEAPLEEAGEKAEDEQMSGAASAEFFDATETPSDAADQIASDEAESELTPSPKEPILRDAPPEPGVDLPSEERPEPEMLAAPQLAEESPLEDSANALPEPSPEQVPPSKPLSALIWVEIGLALLAVFSGATALILHRRGR